RDAEGDIQAVVEEVDQAIDEEGPCAHLRMALEEVEQHRRDMQPAEHRRRGHCELTLRDRMRAARGCFGLVEVREDATAVFEEALARFGQAQAARCSMKQLHA